MTGQSDGAGVSVRWLNTVGFDAYDAPIAEVLNSIKQPGTRVEVVSFEMDATPTHLEYRAYVNRQPRSRAPTAHQRDRDDVVGNGLIRIETWPKKE